MGTEVLEAIGDEQEVLFQEQVKAADDRFALEEESLASRLETVRKRRDDLQHMCANDSAVDTIDDLLKAEKLFSAGKSEATMETAVSEGGSKSFKVKIGVVMSVSIVTPIKSSA